MDVEIDDEDMQGLREAHLAVKRGIYLGLVRRLRTAHEGTTAIDLYDEPTFDDWGVLTLGTWGGYRIQVCEMIYNDRLVMTPGSHPHAGPQHGWCYDKGGAAILAALVWDPETEAEPKGYKKRATAGPRKAGEKAPPEGEVIAYTEALMRILERRA